MARELIVGTTAPAERPAETHVATWQAAHVANKNYYVLGNKTLFARNSGVVERTVIITSVADEQGRTGNLTVTLASGVTKRFPVFKDEGWAQAGRQLWLEADNAEVLFMLVEN